MLNRQTLKVRKGNYAEVVLLGDVHWGSPQCAKDKFLDMVNYCAQKKIYVLLMGDMIEMSTRDSVGSGVYEQEFPGQTQVEQMIECIRPLAKANLLLGSHNGNHCERVYKATGINIAKLMAKEWGCPYLGDACWSKFVVGEHSYTVYSLHGRSGAKFDGTALLALERLAAPFHADVVACGHSHKCISSAVMMQMRLRDRIVEHRKHLVITGHYLRYGGYAQAYGLPPSKLGSPKLQFRSDIHRVSVSW
jgi:predicted phosphodiesterase